MSQNHPELVFIAGPQTGQRVTLSRAAAVLGRGSGSDILLSEEFASREQARYELLQAGPTLENLSTRGTWINGKRFKAGKKVLLETGDLVGVGTDTEILFVSAGDDVDAALADCEEARPAGRSAFGKRLAASEEPVQEPESDLPPPESAAPAPGQPPPLPDDVKPSEMTADERARAERKARQRKILVSLGIYFVVIVGIAVALALYTSEGTDGQQQVPPMLKPDEIAKALRAPVARNTSKIRQEERLKLAVGMYQQYGLQPKYLYRCAQAFKEALAYGGRGFFDQPEHDKVYREVLDRLIEEMNRKYRNAYLLELKEDWQKAEEEFHEILSLFTQEDQTVDSQNPIFKNAELHYNRVKYYRQLKTPSKRAPWQ